MSYPVTAEDAHEMADLGLGANVIKTLFLHGYGMAWLRQCTPQELIAIDGIAEASARNVFRSLDRTEDWEDSGIKVTRRGRNSPILITPPEGMTEETSVPRIDLEAARERISEVLSNLSAVYETETPNDRAALASLAQDLVVREYIQDAVMEALGEGNQARIGALGVVEERMSKGIMAKEKQLEIDLSTRRELQASRKADEVIFDLIVATKKFRKEHVRHIQHCGVLLGLVVVHFPAHFPRTLQVICPRCNEMFEAEIVTEKDLALYVAAGDFAPDNIHPSMGVNTAVHQPRPITDEDLLSAS